MSSKEFTTHCCWLFVNNTCSNLESLKSYLTVGIFCRRFMKLSYSCIIMYYTMTMNIIKYCMKSFAWYINVDWLNPWNMDTPLIRTFSQFPLVSGIVKFHCISQYVCLYYCPDVYVCEWFLYLFRLNTWSPIYMVSWLSSTLCWCD